jgi:hypothetical protein
VIKQFGKDWVIITSQPLFFLLLSFSMKKLLRYLGCFVLISTALTSTQVEARQFVKYKCLARGESAEIVIDTRERINARLFKNSTFDLLIDFDKNNVDFLNNESYRIKFISNEIMEETSKEEFFLKGYEI